MTDYERGVEQASTIYKGVIIGYKAENEKLRELVEDMWRELHAEDGSAQRRMALADRMRELGIEV